MTSGDLLADRRLAFALMLRDQGDHDGAVSVIEQALERAPGWTAARFALAEALASLGRTEEAAAAYRACLAAAPEDAMGAAIRLSLLGAAPAPERLPQAHVRALFDQYAARYEDSLLNNLAYRAPALLRAAVDTVRPPAADGDVVLDLGCGTGLAGAAFRDRARWLEGVDLAPRMIAAAGDKGIYDRLTIADIVAFLAAPPRRYDLVVAADTLVYLGDLQPILAGAARATEAGGLLALTLQKGETAPYLLGADQRYRHAPAYVVEAAAAAQLDIARLEEASYRTEKAEPVPGLVVVLRRRV